MEVTVMWMGTMGTKLSDGQEYADKVREGKNSIVDRHSLKLRSALVQSTKIQLLTRYVPLMFPPAP